MIEIHPQLYIGDQTDFDRSVKGRDEWRVVHACKEPYHRRALGYSGRAAPKHHPEYLLARRDNRLILNLVDAPDPAYIPKEVIDAALDFVFESLSAEHSVLVHCNEGRSRAPSIGFLYLVSRTDSLPIDSLEAALKAFSALYPAYAPKNGVAGFIRSHFTLYAGSRT